MKPRYIIFFKDEDKFERLISRINILNELIKTSRGGEEKLYEYDHFEILTFKRELITENLRGHKAWGIMIEKELYNGCIQSDKLWILNQMLIPHEMFGTINIFD